MIPEEPFEILTRRALEKLRVPSRRCYELVLEELLRMVDQCMPREFMRFPILEVPRPLSPLTTPAWIQSAGVWRCTWRFHAAEFASPVSADVLSLPGSVRQPSDIVLISRELSSWPERNPQLRLGAYYHRAPIQFFAFLAENTCLTAL